MNQICAAALTPREKAVAELLLRSETNAEIARSLSMAERTVKAHMSRMFKRFGIRSGHRRVKLAMLLVNVN